MTSTCHYGTNVAFHSTLELVITSSAAVK